MSSKAEEDHKNAVAELGCLACRLNGIPDSPAEIHHVRIASSHKDDMKVFPLCPIHHRLGMFDIAIHESRPRFENEFMTEQEFLDWVDELLEGA